MGSVYKRNKSYTVSVTVGYDKNGNRIRKTKGGFKTKREAEKYLHELYLKYNNSELYVNENMLLRDFLKYWLNNYVKQNLAENTIAGYKINVYKHIVPKIGNMQVGKIRPIHIQELYTSLLDEGLSPTSVRYIHRNLHSAFHYAAKMQIFNNTAIDNVTPPKGNTFKPNILTRDECRKLLSCVRNTEIFLPVLLALSLGLRRGEVLGLCWKDIDFSKKVLHIERSANRAKGGIMTFAPLKTNSSHRAILLSTEIIKALKSALDWQNKMRCELGSEYNSLNLVCCRSTGEFITTNYLDKQFKRILTENGLPNIRFHDLRHTNATLLIENNVPVKVVSERLGHSDTAITMDIYTHYTEKMQDQCTEVIQSLLFGS